MKLDSKILMLTNKLLQSISSTRFSRGEEFGELSGSYFCDCSSYISSLLKLISLKFFKSILLGKTRLKACDYFKLAKEGNNGVNYHREIDQLTAGEIIVWRKTIIPKSGDTGHMAIILSGPLKIEEGKYRVLVSDCSKILHDADSRDGTGVGSGEMILLTDGEGVISGHIWSKERPKNKMTDVLCISFCDNLIK